MVPSASNIFKAFIWSMVFPYCILLVPEELLAIIPPMVALLVVAGSGAK